MKAFLLIFRRDFKTGGIQPAPEHLQNRMKDWQNRMGSIAARNKLAHSGNRLSDERKVVKPGAIVTNRPHV
jgi:hypothetical protein